MEYKYQVLIAKTKTTVYVLDVQAENMQIAEQKALDKYSKGYWDTWRENDDELNTLEVNYMGEIENA
jgi:hypothetical protein